MKRALFASLLFAALASCTDTPPSEPRTSTETSELIDVSTTCGCNDVTPDPWSPLSAFNYWYTPNGNPVKGMVYVVSSNAADQAHPGTFLAFGFAGQGYQLAWTFRVPLSQYGQFIAEVQSNFANHMVNKDPTTGTTGALPDVWSGGGGGLDGVGTPGPGIPHGYVARMQRTAAQIIDGIRQAQHADANGNVMYQ